MLKSKSKTISLPLFDKSLTKKAYLNALSAMLDYGARVLVGFVIQPLLVAGLGSYLYGVWQFLLRSVGFISPASGNPTAALKWSIANHQTSKDFQAKRLLVGSTMVIYTLFLPLLVVLGGIFAWYSPIWLKASSDLIWSIRLAAGVLVVNMILMGVVEIPRAVLRGENLDYKRMGLTTLLVIIGGGFIFIALYLQTGLVGVSCATVATTILTGVLFFKVIQKNVPWFRAAKPSYNNIKSFLKLNVGFNIWNIINRFMRASDVVVLGIIVSGETVSVYALSRYTQELLINFVAIVVFGITPGLGGIIGAGDFSRAARVRSEIMAFTWLIAAAVGATILLWNKAFIYLWVGEEYYAGNLAMLLITIMITQFVFIKNDASIIDLTLKLRQKVLLGFLSAVVSIILAVGFIKILDAPIVGLCAGFIAGRLILSITYPWLVGRYLHFSFCGQLQNVLRPALITALLFTAMLWLSNMLFINSWFTLIGGVITTLIFAIALSFYSGLTGDQRRRIWYRVKAIT